MGAEHLARTMGTLLSNNVAPEEALAAAEKTAPNHVTAKRLENVGKRVSQGEPFVEVLRTSNIFPPSALEIMAAGEDDDNLDSMMLRINDLYDSDDRMRQGGFPEFLFWIAMIAISSIMVVMVFCNLFGDRGLLYVV